MVRYYKVNILFLPVSMVTSIGQIKESLALSKKETTTFIVGLIVLGLSVVDRKQYINISAQLGYGSIVTPKNSISFESTYSIGIAEESELGVFLEKIDNARLRNSFIYAFLYKGLDDFIEVSTKKKNISKEDTDRIFFAGLYSFFDCMKTNKEHHRKMNKGLDVQKPLEQPKVQTEVKLNESDSNSVEDLNKAQVVPSSLEQNMNGQEKRRSKYARHRLA